MKNFLLTLVSFLMVVVFTTNISAQDKSNKKIVIHRYLVERSFPDGLKIPVNMEGSKISLNVVSTNA